MKYRLICFDLDGTFLSDDKTIPPDNLRAIEAAAAQGIYIVPSSGRIFPGMPEELRDAPYIRYYICGNGALVYDKQEDRILSSAEIEPSLALRLAEYMDTLPVIYDCYQDGMGYMSKDMYDVLQDWTPTAAMGAYMKKIRRPVPDLKKTLAERNRPVTKMQMHFHDLDERSRQLELVPKLFPELIATSSVINNIELNSTAATKGQAVERLAALLGIDLSEVIAFGDGSNDIDMIKTAGTGVAMENAISALLEAADMTAPDNNCGGVARVIERLILKNK